MGKFTGLNRREIKHVVSIKIHRAIGLEYMVVKNEDQRWILKNEHQIASSLESTSLKENVIWCPVLEINL